MSFNASQIKIAQLESEGIPRNRPKVYSVKSRSGQLKISQVGADMPHVWQIKGQIKDK